MRTTERRASSACAPRWLARATAIALIAADVHAQTAAPAADAPSGAPQAAVAQMADPTAVAIGDQLDFSGLAEATAPAPARATAAAASASVIGSRNERPDGSVTITAGQRLPTAWDAKVGVDLAAPATLPDAVPGQTRDRGTGWANVAVPPGTIGLDKATINARVDPATDQGQVSTSLSRSVPVGGGMSVTLQNGYAVTQTLATPTGAPAAPRVLSGDGSVRLELPTATAFSAGASMSSADDHVLPKISAEQKLFGMPFSVTGTISERPTGDTDKSVAAGFKRNW